MIIGIYNKTIVNIVVILRYQSEEEKKSRS